MLAIERGYHGWAVAVVALTAIGILVAIRRKRLAQNAILSREQIKQMVAEKEWALITGASAGTAINMINNAINVRLFITSSNMPL